MVVACGLETGCIYTWSIVSPQKWSALAPDFGEVEENVEYMEAEDEFDVHPAEQVHQRRLDQEDEEPDVVTIDSVKGDVEADGVEPFNVPILLDVEDSDSGEDVIAVGPGTMRRRTPGAGREGVNGTGNGDVEKEGASGRAARSRRR
jgi:COMPASS component SWD1